MTFLPLVPSRVWLTKLLQPRKVTRLNWRLLGWAAAILYHWHRRRRQRQCRCRCRRRKVYFKNSPFQKQEYLSWRNWDRHRYLEYKQCDQIEPFLNDRVNKFSNKEPKCFGYFWKWHDKSKNSCDNYFDNSGN